MGQQDSLPVDYQYLVKGLYGLSRAYRANTMAGHLGAAVTAGYFIAEQQPGLDPEVFRGIESELDRILLGESVFSPQPGAAITVSEMFAPYEAQEAQPEAIETIAQALTRNIGEAHESGHNVIFASIAIRALKDHPELATPPIVNGIRRLITDFDDTSPGSGYYGAKRGRINGTQVELPDDEDFPLYSDLHSMAAAVFDQLILSTGEIKQGYGGLVHIINHAAALCELAKYGYEGLAVDGLRAHHQHVRLWRALPDVSDEFGPETPVENGLRSPDYWQPGNLRPGAARLTHRIKTFYGFTILSNFLDDPGRTIQAENSLLYFM